MEKRRCPINTSFFITDVCSRYCDDSKDCPVLKIEAIIKERNDTGKVRQGTAG